MVSTADTTQVGEVIVEPDIVFGTGGGRDLRCDLYTPASRPTHAPAILLIHGGGWARGVRNMPGLAALAHLLAGRGYVCVSTEYRLSGEAAWPAPIHDAKAALRWLRAEAGRLGVDTNRIAVLGKSAGAHIGMMMAATRDNPAYEGEGGNAGAGTDFGAIISFYGPTRLFRPAIAASDAVRALMGPNHNDAALREVSPLEHVGKVQFPPTLLFHGNKDTVVSAWDSTTMYEALTRAGVPAELHMYAGLPHGFDSAKPLYQELTAALTVDFLERYMA